MFKKIASSISDSEKTVKESNIKLIIFISKVRTVARLIYIRTTLVIGLNVVYLLMFNDDRTEHMSA